MKTWSRGAGSLGDWRDTLLGYWLFVRPMVILARFCRKACGTGGGR
jgi:hypothetical protein